MYRIGFGWNGILETGNGGGGLIIVGGMEHVYHVIIYGINMKNKLIS